MAHSHSTNATLGAAELSRHRRALRILVVVLIPLGIWTIAGLIALWPGDISSHVDKEVSGYSVAGVTYPKARITVVKEIGCDGLAGSTAGSANTRCANVTATLLSGDDKGKAVTVPLTSAIYASGAKVGQQIQLIRIPPQGDQPAQYQFSDFVRGTPLLLLTIVFAVVVVAVARWRGFASLLGLGFSAFILVKFMFPALVAGSNPILIALVGSSAIMFVVLYAAHGFSARTTTALVGTLFGLIVSAGIGYTATRWAHLTGVAAEDDYVLAAAAPDMKLTSVVMCGIIVAGLGVLNDVTITQASAVWELADSGGSQRHLFARAMRIGRDHIASTVYTIAFATAGASLSVLLLIAVYDRPLLQVLQTEQFSGEILRTLAGSIALVLAVPLTTAIGVAVVFASARGRTAAARTGSPAVSKRLDRDLASDRSVIGDDSASGSDAETSEDGTVGEHIKASDADYEDDLDESIFDDGADRPTKAVAVKSEQTSESAETRESAGTSAGSAGTRESAGTSAGSAQTRESAGTSAGSAGDTPAPAGSGRPTWRVGADGAATGALPADETAAAEPVRPARRATRRPNGSEKPAASSESGASSEQPARTRRGFGRRRAAEDDLDFSDLRDPGDTDPGPGSKPPTGRRGLS